MMNICFKAILLISFVIFSINSYGTSESQNLNSSYFGQKKPGLIAEIFAKDTVSIEGRYEHGIAFSSKLDEMYFSGNKEGENAAIYFSKLVNNQWTKIQQVDFTNGQKAQEMHPFVSNDGQRLYFTAYNSDFTDNKIWYVNRQADAWSEAIKLDSPVNEHDVFYSNLSNNGDLYFFSLTKGKTFYAALENDSYPEIKEVNIDYGVHAFIAPSQDYLVANARNKEDDSRKSDIYVYFKKKDGSWSKPINLGENVNTNYNETVPSITPDGKYLFFSRYNEEGGLSNFYWVSTEVIERLRPKE